MTVTSVRVMATRVMDMAGSRAATHQPTHDPAMNSVTVLTTFGVSQFLADNVGIMATNADILPTFPTKKCRHRVVSPDPSK